MHQRGVGLVRTKHRYLHSPCLALVSSSKLPLANGQNAEQVPHGPPPRESLIKALREEREGTWVSHAVVPRVSWVKRRGLSSATDGLGRASMKPKQEEITFPFVKCSRGPKTGQGSSDASMQNKDSIFSSVNSVSWLLR